MIGVHLTRHKNGFSTDCPLSHKAALWCHHTSNAWSSHSMDGGNAQNLEALVHDCSCCVTKKQSVFMDLHYLSCVTKQTTVWNHDTSYSAKWSKRIAIYRLSRAIHSSVLFLVINTLAVQESVLIWSYSTPFPENVLVLPGKPLSHWFSTYYGLWPPSKDSQHLWTPAHQLNALSLTLNCTLGFHDITAEVFNKGLCSWLTGNRSVAPEGPGWETLGWGVGGTLSV